MSSEITAYLCDFCPMGKRKRFATRSGATRHERQCFYNPLRRACASCSHFFFEKYDHETGEGGPFCDLDALNRDPEALTVLRSECQLWADRPQAGTDAAQR